MRGKSHHYGGHRSGGLHVGSSAKRSGPQPGKTEFSANEEKAMRAGAPGADAGAPMMGGAPAPAPAAPAGGMPMGGAPVPQDLDQDGGI